MAEPKEKGTSWHHTYEIPTDMTVNRLGNKWEIFLKEIKVLN